MRNKNLGRRILQVEKRSIDRKRLAVKTLTNTRKRKSRIPLCKFLQALLTIKMRPHDFRFGKILSKRRKPQRRVEYMLDSSFDRRVDSFGVYFCPVFVDMARIRDEKKHIDAGKDGLEIFGARLV
ncbi:hypothetical protein HG531_005814 [Fusarium graminearum]|nr:hypothetical protein HG531_005814 [Fusarium graminearum]